MIRFRLPWNQKCVLGWIVETIYTETYTIAYLSVNPAFLTLFISFCHYHRAFYKMFELKFQKIDELIETKPNHKYEIKKMILDSISFHLSVKR